MANVLTNLIPTLYNALDTVSREQVGFIPAVYRDSNAGRAAVGQTIRFPVVPTASAADISAAATGPDPSDSTTGSGTLSIAKSRGVTFFWTGEEVIGLGGTYQPILQNQFAQAMRTLCNEVEADIAALYTKCGRAYGTAGTNPFDRTDLAAAAQVRKLLEDCGAPMGNMRLIVNTTAAASLRTMGLLTKASEAGSAMTLRTGAVGDILGMQVGISGQIKTHTAGTGAATWTTNGTQAAAATTLALDSGSGTILEGDVLTFTGYTPKYVAYSDLSAGALVINSPGLAGAVAADTTATLAANYTANMAFDQNAIALVTRVPAMPQGGDAADDVIEVLDPVSGLAFQVAMYRQRRRIAYEVGLAWGTAAIKSAHMALLLG